MIKALRVAAVLAVLVSSLNYGASYGGGSGTPEDPYRIWTPEQMNLIGANLSDWDKHFKLMDDVDMSVYTGTQYNIIGNLNNPFKGTFDGSNHVIRNFSYSSTSSDIGLFGWIRGSVKNLHLENVAITGGRCGGLASVNLGLIINCHVTGSVTGTVEVGGLVGRNDGTLVMCRTAVQVSGTGDYIGGLIGSNGSEYGSIGVVSACTSEGPVEGIGASADCVGGLLGRNRGGSVTASAATGSVVAGGNYAGGLVGYSDGTQITACYATGSVTANRYAGGLVGSNNRTATSMCYSTGSVSGTEYVGGLLGSSEPSAIYACYWNTQTSETTDGVGAVADPAGVTGLSTAAMKIKSSFAGLDFVDDASDGFHDFWQLHEGQYPTLTTDHWTLAGQGTTDHPFVIRQATDLGRVSFRPDASYCLQNDLDLGGISLLCPVVPAFAGNFDGKGFVISNFILNLPANNYMGFFGRTWRSEIRNLGLRASSVTGRLYAGSLAGKCEQSTITGCFAIGSVSGTPNLYKGTGGLIGMFADSEMTNCYADCLIASNAGGGGLVGFNTGSLLRHCYSSSSYIGTRIEGLVGYQDYGLVTSCFWDATKTGWTGTPRTPQTTAQMMTASTFTSAGWDFLGETANGITDAWRMCGNGLDYPRLRREYSSKGDLLCPNDVFLSDFCYLISYWLESDCSPANNWCDTVDADQSGTVDILDLSALASNWLKQ